ncbi:MAG: AMP-binding protein [Steroidobacteraceae bacterium]|jgi:acyl-CoA synthetase (AMP-forming)/AMP-acid ligase II|nr:AMP-binding protein [Steroidobacteraceae bacterium]
MTHAKPFDEPAGIFRVSDLLSWYAARTPHAEAAVLDDLRIDYAGLAHRVDELARALLAAGVAKGDRVATLATPHPDYFVAFLATVSIGAIWVGLNPRHRSDELAYVVGDCDPDVLLTRTRIDGRDYAAEIAAMRRAAPSLRRVVALDEPRPEIADERRAFLDSGGDVPDRVLAAARADCGGRDPCLIVYTSGSTGRPKGAMLHHEGIVQVCLLQNRVWPVPRQRVVNFLPINHVGCVVDLSCPTLAAGGCVVFMERFDAAASMELTVRERASWWISVPSVFQMQLALPEFERYDLSAVRLVVWEGAAMPEPIIRRLLEIVPTGVATNYSMTESTGAITVVPPTTDVELLASSVGRPAEGVEVRIVGEDGRELPPGEPGEIQARSPYNMLGYWNRPQETAETLLPDGWLRTGDVAVQRPDGSYRIVGRLKEMFKSGGYNVYPREIENVLETHPAVALAAVVSRPDPLWQEVGVAYVIARTPVAATELEAHCRERLANYKVPKTFEIRDALPLLPIGKVDKVALRRMAAEGR